MSGLFGSTVIPGNRLTDVAAQTSTVGIPIPFGYGRFEADGNIIWTDVHKEHVTKKRQGKGGVKVEEITYTRSYAIGFAAGPIFGFLTITRNGKVVYTNDPNATVEDAAYAAKWLSKATLYYGTEEQLPDSTIEAVEGAGQISAFKGLSYIVLENDDVTDNGAGVPGYKAIVIASAPDVYLTTPPYALVEENAVAASASPNKGYILGDFILEASAASIPLGGALREIKQVYDTAPESTDAASVPLGGVLREVKLVYSNYAPELTNAASIPLGGSLITVKIIYPNYAAEATDAASVPLGGTLT